MKNLNVEVAFTLVLVAVCAGAMLDLFVRRGDSVYGHLFMAIVRCVS